jgi:hypothetical protein
MTENYANVGIGAAATRLFSTNQARPLRSTSPKPFFFMPAERPFQTKGHQSTGFSSLKQQMSACGRNQEHRP